jgi:hypothetical protein
MKNLLNKLIIQFLGWFHGMGIKMEKLSYGGSGSMPNMDQVADRIEALNAGSEKLSYGGKGRSGGWQCPNGYRKSEDGTYCIYVGGGQQYDKDFYDGQLKGSKGFIVKGKFIPMIEAAQRNKYDKDFLRGKTPVTVLVPVATPDPRSSQVITPRDQAPSPAPRPTYPAETVTPVDMDAPKNQIPTETSILQSDNFDVKIDKTVINAGIPDDLPVVLFAPMYRASDYVTLVGVLPAGVTLTVTNVGAGNLAFTYVNGADSVVLTVSATRTPYTSILSALITDRWELVRIRESVTDVTALAQLNLALEVSTGSMWGGQSFNEVSANAAKGPYQDQDTIVDFDFLASVDKAKAIRLLILGSAPDGFRVTLTLWGQHVRKP